MSTLDARAFLALYDELLEDYQRLKRDVFANEVTRRCSEFNRTHPGYSEMLVAMQMHFNNKY